MMERYTSRGDESLLNASLCADPVHRPTAIKQAAGNSERRVHVPPGSTCSNQCAARLGRQIDHATTLADVSGMDRLDIAKG